MDLIDWLANHIFKVNRQPQSIFRLAKKRGFHPRSDRILDEVPTLYVLEFGEISDEALRTAIRVLFTTSKDAVVTERTRHHILFPRDAVAQ
jgi:hypothetical protein